MTYSVIPRIINCTNRTISIMCIVSISILLFIDKPYLCIIM